MATLFSLSSKSSGVGKTKLKSNVTLLDRLGGPPAVDLLTNAFIQEIGKDANLAPFFVQVPLETLRLHQKQFLEVVLGHRFDKKERSSDDLVSFLISTHSRLFREMGLDATHFDLVAACLVQACQKLKVPVDLMKQCLAVVGPLRAAFVKGAAFARKEKIRQEQKHKEQKRNDEKENLGKEQEVPKNQTPWRKGYVQQEIVESEIEVCLSETSLSPALPPPPQWLVDKLERSSRQSNCSNKLLFSEKDESKQNDCSVIQTWTFALTHRVTVQDPLLRPIFLCIRYMDLVPYIHALLQIAFAEEDSDNQNDKHCTINTTLNKGKLIRILRFPQGISKPQMQLTQDLFACLVHQFTQVGMELLGDSGSNNPICQYPQQQQENDSGCTLLFLAKGNLEKIQATFVERQQQHFLIRLSQPAAQGTLAGERGPLKKRRRGPLKQRGTSCPPSRPATVGYGNQRLSHLDFPCRYS